LRNGFIPGFVKENRRRMCEVAGAEIVVLSFEFHDEV
jgi:hypothetical protein